MKLTIIAFKIAALLLVALLAQSNLSAAAADLSVAAAQSAPREGDIIFQTSRSSQSIAVQRATGSPYSHMGVILQKKDGLCVFEAVATVRCTPLEQWIKRGVDGHYVIKRLKDDREFRLPEGRKRLIETAGSFSGLPYDLTFEWSDARIYCSELVWKIFNRAFGISIGELSKLRDFDLTSPAVKQKIVERYKGNIPLGENVISPSSMFDSKLLVEVGRQ
jgi:hypothetical protein